MRWQRIEQLADRQIADLHRMYQDEWWTQGRQLTDVRKMLEHTDVVLGYCDGASGRLVAFARVLTDATIKALILDVIVHPEYRGQGLGQTLMEGILAHPRLQGVQHFELYCLPEMTAYYRRLGFTEDTRGLCLMRADTRQQSGASGRPCQVVYRLSDQQRADFDRMYGAVWWTQGQPLPDVERMLQSSDVIVGLCDDASQRLFAFARVVTDFVYKAVVMDVIVDQRLRGQDWGRRLMDEIVSHPSLKTVGHLELCCLPELVPFYEQWSFADDLGELRLMRKYLGGHAAVITKGREQ